MAKIQKTTPPPFILVVDTNILFHTDKQFSVHPDFDLFWNSHSREYKIELKLPEIVIGELQFQQVTSAIKAMKNASENLGQVNLVCNGSYSHRATDANIKSGVNRKISSWIKRKDASVIPTPISHIDWGQIINSAVWRLPPFSFDSKNPTEKGFRDALILETLVHFCKHETSQKNIIFISNDTLLRTTATDRLKSDQRCAFYESLNDFASYLKLTKEKLTDQFIKSLLAKASEKFFSRDDPDSLYYKENVKERLKTDFKDDFENPEKAESSLFRTLLTTPEFAPTWEPAIDGRWWIYSAQYEKLIGEKNYWWKSSVTYVRLYIEKSAAPGGTPLFPRQRKLFVLPFEIYWSANVKSDGRFHDLKIEKMEKGKSKFTNPTPEDIKAYRLEAEDS